MGYALWLVPSEPQADALRYLMNFRPQHYRSSTHSSRSYPRFDPHITLATFSCPYRPSLYQFLPSDVNSAPVYFQSMKIGNNYLGSLSIVISKSRELMDLHDLVVKHLEKVNKHLQKVNKIHHASRSFPHMSLFYLDEAFQGERLQLCNALRQSGRVYERIGNITDVALNCTLDGATPQFHAMKGFHGSEIWLVDCTGAVADWRVLGKRMLNPSGACISRDEPSFYRPSHFPVVAMAPPPPRFCGRGPFFFGPNPVLPMIPYHPQDPRIHRCHYAQSIDPRCRGNMCTCARRRAYVGAYGRDYI
ncbi:cyclic phosphodiesterase-like protein-domain-containing protein [Suillus lakei]|nr:cyclic phosphodiesterase-like protein-domain-containing protein [Suillus lakei]